jgi:outer membrane lipoprotein-sorting protein
MHRLQSILVCILLFRPVTGHAAVQDHREALNLLKRVSAAYAWVETYRAEGTATIRAGDTITEKPKQVKFTISLMVPDKVRVEIKGPNGDVLLVTNGKSTWVYARARNEYAVRTPWVSSDPLLVAPVPWPSESKPPDGDLLMLWNGKSAEAYAPLLWPSEIKAIAGLLNYRRLRDNVESATILRGENLPFEGGIANCYVVKAVDRVFLSSSPPMSEHFHSQSSVSTLWIEKSPLRVLRQVADVESLAWSTGGVDGREETFTFNKIERSVPFPDGFFTFSPPESAKEVPTLIDVRPPQKR